MIVFDKVINSIFSSVTYIFHEVGGLDYWLVDIGDIEPVLTLLSDGACVRGVFITHSHYDHIYGINALTERFPECIVYTSEHGREGLYSDKLNISRYHNDRLVYQGKNVCVLHEGDRVELWPGVVVEVFETPGHDWSCLTYRIGDAVFSGDSYLPGVEVFTKFPKSDAVLAAESVKRIMDIACGRVIWPGHGGLMRKQK